MNPNKQLQRKPSEKESEAKYENTQESASELKREIPEAKELTKRKRKSLTNEKI